jgi:hypothetical protein
MLYVNIEEGSEIAPTKLGKTSYSFRQQRHLNKQLETESDQFLSLVGAYSDMACGAAGVLDS